MIFKCGRCFNSYEAASAAKGCSCWEKPWPLPPAGHPGPVEMIDPPGQHNAGMGALGHQEGGDHYRAMKIQPIEFIHANGIPFAEGCVIKYVSRWRSKNGLADLKKARHFLDLLIELEEKARG